MASKKELEIQASLGSLSTLPVEQRFDYFKKNALKGVKPIFDRNMTYQNYLDLSEEEWFQIKKRAIIAFNHIGKIFKRVKIEYDHFIISYNTRLYEDWSSLSFDDLPNYEDNIFLAEIYDYLGLDDNIIRELVMCTDICDLCKYVVSSQDS